MTRMRRLIAYNYKHYLAITRSEIFELHFNFASAPIDICSLQCTEMMESGATYIYMERCFCPWTLFHWKIPKEIAFFFLLKGNRDYILFTEISSAKSGPLNTIKSLKMHHIIIDWLLNINIGNGYDSVLALVNVLHQFTTLRRSCWISWRSITRASVCQVLSEKS